MVTRLALPVAQGSLRKFQVTQTLSHTPVITAMTAQVAAVKLLAVRVAVLALQQKQGLAALPALNILTGGSMLTQRLLRLLIYTINKATLAM